MLRRNENLNQLVDQRTILAFMLHGEKIQLVVQPHIQIRGFNLQCVIHEHIVKSAIAALVFSDIELVAVLAKIQMTDDAV